MFKKIKKQLKRLSQGSSGRRYGGFRGGSSDRRYGHFHRGSGSSGRYKQNPFSGSKRYKRRGHSSS